MVSPAILKLTAFLACANAATVTDIFPTSSTTNLAVMCKAGFTIGGGLDAAAQATAWSTVAACRIHCECVAVDGSCKYCCKKDGAQCVRHLPLYQYAAGSCLKCNADQYLHEAGVSGTSGKSAVDASVQWVHRGSFYGHDLVKNSAGIRFVYLSDFVACWSNDGRANGAQDAASCTDFGSETTASVAPTGDATDFVSPYLSPVLNQGGCGSCYIQAATSTLTDRALLKMSLSQRTAWTDASMSYSTGQGSRCHWAAGSGGNSCDGGDPGLVMEALASQPGTTVATGKPAAPFGASTCTGGVYGGPGIASPYASGVKDFYAKWDYGCNSGCTPYHAGFDGPPLPAGATCPADYTDDAVKMQAGFFPDGSVPTSTNFQQYSVACGCGGTFSNSGPCTYCGAFSISDNSLYPFGQWADIALADCNYAGVAKAMKAFNWVIAGESDWSGFAMTGDAVMALPEPQHKKDYMMTSLSCTVTPSVNFGSTTTCTKCCMPKPATPVGYQYNPKVKAAQPPASCTGSGVTAGSTAGAAACSIKACTGTCDTTGAYPSTKVGFDNSPNNVYNPIGMIVNDVGYETWHPIFEHFIKDEITQHGPVSAAFKVTGNFGSFFAATPTGIMTMQKTDTPTISGGHAVSIVGWGVDGGNKYWLVRNSWGRSWADSGFFRVEIGGGMASITGFGASGINAMSAVLQTGTFRRLDSDGGAKSRRLAAITKNATTLTEKTHGGHETCTAHHTADVNALRTWFLANISNYKGVSPQCSAPWEYVDSGACTAQVIKGLHIKVTFHLKDCNGTRYHMVTRLAHDGVNMTTAQILANSGPEVTKVDPAHTTPDGAKRGIATTSSALRGAANFVATLFVVAQMMQ